MKKFLLIFFILQFRVYGYFSDESKEIMLQGEFRFSNSWVSSVWSSCHARKFSQLKLNADHLIIPVKSSGFSSGEYLTNVLLNRGEQGQNVISAPVTIIINGIFGEPVSGLVRQIADQAIKKGHHVVGLGNPLGTWGLKQMPTYTIANFVQESEVYLNIIDEINQWMNVRQFSNGQVNIVGVSYGGLIASIIKAIDIKRDRPIITGMTTLFSPPLKMGPALRNMDHVLFQTQQIGKLPDWALAMGALKFCLFPPRYYVNNVQLDWAKGIFGFYGFQRNLSDNTILLNEMYHLNKIPTEEKARLSWRRTFNFEGYISGFAQELGELMDSEVGELYYWLNQIPEKEVQIFSSLDDPLNEGEVWPDRENIFLIDYGGHYGFRGFSFFDKFLASIF